MFIHSYSLYCTTFSPGSVEDSVVFLVQELWLNLKFTDIKYLQYWRRRKSLNYMKTVKYLRHYHYVGVTSYTIYFFAGLYDANKTKGEFIISPKHLQHYFWYITDMFLWLPFCMLKKIITESIRHIINIDWDNLIVLV